MEKNELNEWAKNISYNYNHNTDTDILAQLYDCVRGENLSLGEMEKRWEIFGFRGNGKWITWQEVRWLIDGESKNTPYGYPMWGWA
ncbi:unnamed protein product [marine sediment metagenome]|uniref:Uncharacterized protein n=1 Tax=marine sediment metagenome TaxID=412755 RepID=X1LED1_9ZZZZ